MTGEFKPFTLSERLGTASVAGENIITGRMPSSRFDPEEVLQSRNNGEPQMFSDMRNIRNLMLDNEASFVGGSGTWNTVNNLFIDWNKKIVGYGGSNINEWRDEWSELHSLWRDETEDQIPTFLEEIPGAISDRTTEVSSAVGSAISNNRFKIIGTVTLVALVFFFGLPKLRNVK